MCKILTITGVNPANKKLAKFIKQAVPVLTGADDDGFGYAAVNQDGLFGERWVNVKEALKHRGELSPQERATLTEMGSSITPIVEYNSFGTVPPNFEGVTSVILHARASTNVINLSNTHPFVDDNTALIHNGVIENTRFLDNKTSTCDSECILNEYVSSEVKANPAKIQEVADRLVGYYACAVLAKTEHGFILDVFKDELANLYFAKIPELNYAKVWCTDRDQLVDICEEAGFKKPKIFVAAPGHIVRVNAQTGKTVSITQFETGNMEADFKKQTKKNSKLTHWGDSNGYRYGWDDGYDRHETDPAYDMESKGSVIEPTSVDRFMEESLKYSRMRKRGY